MDVFENRVAGRGERERQRILNLYFKLLFASLQLSERMGDDKAPTSRAVERTYDIF